MSRILEKVYRGLNERQRQAVQAPAKGILQIVAGPGTGKTKVLMARVAYLLLSEDISPEHIIVTTFTKKAANEMMDRLRELLRGTEIAVGKLLIGTFHSICYRIIQKYGARVGLEGYSIADDRDSRQVLNEAVLGLPDEKWDEIDQIEEMYTLPFKSNDDKYRGLDPKKLQKAISSLKARGLLPEDYAKEAQKNPLSLIVYQAYQERLAQNRVLDFDDCLLYCHRIVSKYPVLSYIEHTLVDEFQDTNEVQLQLMYHFAKGSLSDPELQNNVTIVGDPDQSIYAFRNAQSINFDKMRQHYKHHKLRVITLEENYRSTPGILSLSEKLMHQQAGRTMKELRSQSQCAIEPVYGNFHSAEEEAAWVASRIKQIMTLPSFQHSDCAILVRSAYQTRAIETELARKKIPYFMVKGRAFWERKEVVAMMDYLRCVANENDRIAYLRCVNFPKRGFGPKAVAELESQIEKGGSVFETLQNLANGSVSSSLGPKLRKSLEGFLRLIEKHRQALPDDVEGTDDLGSRLDKMFTGLYVQSGLQKEFAENVDCELNIMEVKNQLVEYEMPEEDYLPDYLEEGEAPVPTEIEVSGQRFLQTFIASVRLFDTDPEQGEKDATPKVAVSTIHGAKGLEWPVVFVPGVSEGLLPASFAMTDEESVNEERRCFYVAVTRAKALLLLSSYVDGPSNGSWRGVEKVSRFLKGIAEKRSRQLSFKDLQALEHLYDLLGKEKADLTDELIKKFHGQDAESKTRFNDYSLEFSSAREAKPVKKSRLNFLNQRSVGVSQKWNAPAPQKAVGSAPASFKPPRVSPSFAPQSAPQETPLSSGVKRAPTYIPSRPKGKKRLGTRW
ncbi:uncharacterized protein CXQ87_001497 [Candidozyma duobushaemuli]|uniref:DNA 3'-5' helicase n=2 Tax=Candidozyma TaxID=3303203 RepID=A0ABX8I552_9ASCO|nr:uncharacterized protein CXQ87_001497 [[Candida] duobushaemulonis]PVH18566.1 hypothetical protein CXQ87_001497 [[Candida] duobushaemulonis]QWU87087.1 hypothetical protein CA3LBN_001305 [[Candida] haemuloni]